MRSGDYRFTVHLIIGKLEEDGAGIGTFHLFDYEEILPYNQLEEKLTEFCNKGIQKVKEMKDSFVKI